MVALALAIGAVIGISLGALGGGGSILTVPALVYVLGQTPHAATTGSLLIVGITSLAGAVAHFRAGRVRIGAGGAFGLLGVAGSYVGSRLSAGVRPDLLLAGFAVLMLVAAAAMVRRRGRDERPAPQASSAAPAVIEEEFARGLPARGAIALVEAAP
ncbi:TSUP family transporter, partial [Acidimicrobiaceae bacterium USS-CC1]|nr:TSUP family transporter [Acidiferrimicrobium australe]